MLNLLIIEKTGIHGLEKFLDDYFNMLDCVGKRPPIENFFKKYLLSYVKFEDLQFSFSFFQGSFEFSDIIDCSKHEIDEHDYEERIALAHQICNRLALSKQIPLLFQDFWKTTAYNNKKTKTTQHLKKDMNVFKKILEKLPLSQLKRIVSRSRGLGSNNKSIVYTKENVLVEIYENIENAIQSQRIENSTIVFLSTISLIALFLRLEYNKRFVGNISHLIKDRESLIF